MQKSKDELETLRAAWEAYGNSTCPYVDLLSLNMGAALLPPSKSKTDFFCDQC